MLSHQRLQFNILRSIVFVCFSLSLGLELEYNLSKESLFMRSLQQEPHVYLSPSRNIKHHNFTFLVGVKKLTLDYIS